MDNEELKQIFNFDWEIPIALNHLFWNGRPDNWSNIKNHGLRLSQSFAMHALDYSQFGLKGHNGLDIAATQDTPVVAPIRMWIAETVRDNEDMGYGNSVWAESETVKLNGESYKMQLVFGHLSIVLANAGHWVEKGTIIGYVGTTGFSTGPHLHHGTRPMMIVDNNWQYIFPGNGYGGYIDPQIFLPHMVWDYKELITLDKLMAELEKKIIIEGEGVGRKGIIVNGKLREIKKGREGDACLYVLANNKLGKTINSQAFDEIEKDVDF